MMGGIRFRELSKLAGNEEKTPFRTELKKK
jgi:hypothetical protein